MIICADVDSSFKDSNFLGELMFFYLCLALKILYYVGVTGHVYTSLRHNFSIPRASYLELEIQSAFTEMLALC